MELLDKRTYTQKHHNIGNNQIRMEAHIGHIHYRDGALKDGVFNDVNTTLNYNPVSKLYSMTNASYEAEIGLYGDIRFHNIDHSIQFTLANPYKIEAVGYDGSEFGKIGKGLIWHNIIQDGGHQIVEARNGSLTKIFRFDKKPLSNIIDFDVSLSNVEHDIDIDLVGKQERLGSKDRKSFLRHPKAWNHRGESIDIQFVLKKNGKAQKIIPQSFIDSTFTELNAWLECDTTTSYYAGAGDGSSWYNGANGGTWSTTRDASVGTYTPGGTTGYILSALSGTAYNIRRLFLPVDTSGIPDTATVLSAIFNLWTTGGGTTTTRGVAFVQTTQADCTTLVSADYGRITLNSPTEGSNRMLMSEFSSNSYRTINLNSNGVGWVSKIGYTKLMLRETLCDIDNVPPITDIYIYTRGSTYAGTNFDPYLDVIYSEGKNYFTKITQLQSFRTL